MATIERELRRREPKSISPTTDTVVRSSDYSIASAEMALAIGSIPPARRSNWWLLALAAPIASASVREAIRPKFFNETQASPWTLLAPALVGLAGAGVLLLGKHYTSPRARHSCG
jgi:hypothetical protein